MRILYLTDVHFKMKSPINRIDNYYDSIKDKFQEVLEIAKKEKVDIIIDGGDILDSPIVSLKMCDEIIEMIEKNQISYYGIFGNHSLINGHIENSESSTLAHIFRRSKWIKYLDNIDLTDTNENLYIKGYEYYHGIENDIRDKGLYHEIKDENVITIAVPHILITEKPLPYQAFHVPYKDLKTNYDFVLVSHNHFEFGIKEVGKTKIISIGALCRLTAHEKDYSRKPKIAIIDTETKEVETIELKIAKPLDQIFDLQALKERKDSEAGLSDFIEKLQSTKIQSLNLHEIITEIGVTKKAPVEVIEEIKKRIGDFEDEKGI